MDLFRFMIGISYLRTYMTRIGSKYSVEDEKE